MIQSKISPFRYAPVEMTETNNFFLPMSSIRITLDISSESDDYEDSIREAMQGILDGNKWGKNENDTDSYEFSVEHVYR